MSLYWTCSLFSIRPQVTKLSTKSPHAHRHMSQGADSALSQTRAKPLFFGQKLNFSGRRQQPKMKEIIFFGIY